MSKALKGFLELLTSFVSRAGLQIFVSKFLPDAIQIVAGLMAIHNNKDFASWRDDAFARLKKLTGETKDTWITLLIAYATQWLEPGTKGGNWLMRAFKWIGEKLGLYSPLTKELLVKYRPAAEQIILKLRAAKNNAEFKDIEREAIAELQKLYKELSDAWAALIINAVYESLKAATK